MKTHLTKQLVGSALGNPVAVQRLQLQSTMPTTPTSLSWYQNDTQTWSSPTSNGRFINNATGWRLPGTRRFISIQQILWICLRLWCLKRWEVGWRKMQSNRFLDLAINARKIRTMTKTLRLSVNCISDTSSSSAICIPDAGVSRAILFGWMWRC